EDRPAGSGADETLVVGARLETGEGRRRRREAIVANGAGGDESIADVRQLCVENTTRARLQIMRLAKLRDAAARPVLPRLGRRTGDGSRVALEHRDVVPVAREQHAGGETAHPGAEYDDPSHARPASLSDLHCQVCEPLGFASAEQQEDGPLSLVASVRMRV